jgi:ABC-type branched-subunit amino acid transport system permease subunit
MKSEMRAADWIGGRRTILFYLLAAALILSAVVGVAGHVSLSRSAFWVLACVVVALHLTPAGTALNRSPVVRSLLNDESVRQHRLLSFSAGFWAMIVCSIAIALVTTFVALPAMATSQIIASAGLSSALIMFATLERRAARG